MSIDHEKIMNRLVSEAFDNPRVGWLADMPEDDLLFNERTESIEVYGVGSIDVGQLAGVVLEIIEEANSDD